MTNPREVVTTRIHACNAPGPGRYVDSIHKDMSIQCIFRRCSVAGHVPTLPWVRSRVWVMVRVSYREGVGRDVARNQA